MKCLTCNTLSSPTYRKDTRQYCTVMAARSKPNATEQRMALEKSAGKPVALIEHLARSAVSEIAQRELARMHDLLAGKEVEEFQTSYHNCGLGSRWPGAV